MSITEPTRGSAMTVETEDDTKINGNQAGLRSNASGASSGEVPIQATTIVSVASTTNAKIA